MGAEMTSYDRLVPRKGQSEYHWFGITSTFRCNHCDQTNEQVRTYFLAERFCPNPDCTCRSLILDVFRLDGSAADSIANSLVDLDDFHVSMQTWRNVKVETGADKQALQYVTRHLNTNSALLQKFQRHWEEVRMAVEVRHKRKRHKQLATLRGRIRR